MNNKMNTFTKIVIITLIGLAIIAYLVAMYYKNEVYGNYINIIALFVFINSLMGTGLIYLKYENEKQKKNLKELGL